MMKLGDAVFLLGLWVWLTIAVGPWWVGIGLFALGSVLNWVTRKEDHGDG